MNYHHFDHLDRFAPAVSVGARVKKGDLAGYCGKSGTTSPHCHYEIMVQKPINWLQYTYGKTLAEVQKLYMDPKVYVNDTLPMKWSSLGYGYLSPITSPKGVKGFHPGVDLNWGSGADDLGLPVYFTCDGVIEYVGKKETDGGAGNNLWWSEQGEAMGNVLVQDVNGSGQFALVFGGKRRAISAERAGLAALTVHARAMAYKALTKAEWEAIPAGTDF